MVRVTGLPNGDPILSELGIRLLNEARTKWFACILQAEAALSPLPVTARR